MAAPENPQEERTSQEVAVSSQAVFEYILWSQKKKNFFFFFWQKSQEVGKHPLKKRLFFVQHFV